MSGVIVVPWHHRATHCPIQLQMMLMVCKINALNLDVHLRHLEKPYCMTFHLYMGYLLIILGILEMDYYNPPYTRNNRGFGHCSFLLDTSNSYHQTISRMVGNRGKDDTESTPWLGEVLIPSRHTTRYLESNATRVRIYNIYPPWN